MSSCSSGSECAKQDSEDEDCAAKTSSEFRDDSSSVGIWPAVLAGGLSFYAFFMTVPYVSQVIMHSPYATVEPNHRNHVMMRTQHAITVCHSVQAFAELFSSGILGVLCDRVGVKPIGVISLVGQFVHVLVLTLCSRSPGDRHGHIQQVFTAMVLASGFTGACGNIKIAGGAYVARVSTPATRNRNFLVMGATVGLCVCLGPLSGVLVHKLTGETRPVLWLATACSLASVVVALWSWPGRKLLPLPDHPAEWKEAVPCFLFRSTVCTSIPLMIFALLNFVDHFALSMLHGGYAVFVRKQYHWSTDKLSLFLVTSGMWGPLVQRLLVPVLLKRRDEFFVLKLGYSFTLASFIATWLIGLQSDGDLLFASTVPAGLGHMAGPIQTSLASGMLPKSEMGRLFAAFAFLETLSKVIAPVGSEFVMHRTLAGPMPSAVFLAAALVIAPAVALAFFVKRFAKQAAGARAEDYDTGSSSEYTSAE